MVYSAEDAEKKLFILAIINIIDSVSLSVYGKAMIDLDRHRESVSKYLYDISKIVITLAVLNPVFSQTVKVDDIIIGTATALVFLFLALFIEGRYKI